MSTSAFVAIELTKEEKIYRANIGNNLFFCHNGYDDLRCYKLRLLEDTKPPTGFVMSKIEIGHIMYEKEYIIEIKKEVIFLFNFRVNQKCRNKGYGTKIIQELLKLLNQNGNNLSIVATVLEDNMPSKKAFEKNEFTEILRLGRIIYYQKN